MGFIDELKRLARPYADEDDEDSEPDLFAALASKGEPAFKPPTSTQDPPRQVSLFDKPPIFSYGGAKE